MTQTSFFSIPSLYEDAAQSFSISRINDAVDFAIEFVCRDFFADLDVESEGDQNRRLSFRLDAALDESVVISFAAADATAFGSEAETRDDDQVETTWRGKGEGK